MELDGSFSLAELGPREKRQTKIDGRGIKGINRLLWLDTKIFGGIKNSGLANQDVGEIGVDPPVTQLIGMSQGVAEDHLSNIHMPSPRDEVEEYAI
jgi:hypothetical protein